MPLLTIGVAKTSYKENERRVPIHPEHLGLIPEPICKQLIFENGYGLPFGVRDEHIASKTGGLASRDEILAHCDAVLIPKPVQEDFENIKEAGILCGWCHCVQQQEFTQIAVERRLTIIAWEAMNTWGPNGEFKSHIFEKNNEIAGYAGVLDALRLAGISGHYGPERKVVVISYGLVSRGATRALQNQGFKDITVFTQRPSDQIHRQDSGIKYREIKTEAGLPVVVNSDGSLLPFIDEITSANIIVNGLLQDPNSPLMFIKENETNRLKPGSLIIDISCDEGMGFPFARPTTFDEPIIKVEAISYYAVDHTPSYLWNSASWEISKSLIPYLPVISAGIGQWNENETIRRAIDIKAGVIQNPNILSFQNRSSQYPHLVNTYKMGNVDMNGTERKNIRVGAKVKIVQKQHQRTGQLTEGVVKDILTNSAVHHRGIKVRLENGTIGRVQEVCGEEMRRQD